MKLRFNPLALLGLRFGRECRAYYWIGLSAWIVAGLAGAYAEYHLRVPDPPGNYLIEAFVAVLTPLMAMMWADALAVGAYQEVAYDLNFRSKAPRLVDEDAVKRVRRDLRGNPLLRWVAPPENGSMRGQLMSAALWYPALMLPASAPWRRRYGEWLLDMLGGYGLGLLAAVLAVLAPAAAGLFAAILCGAVALGVLGYSSIRLAARRQAILDFFTTWLS